MEKPLLVSLVIMWLLLKWVSCQQKVEQNPPFWTVHEGESITINCTFSSQTSQGLQWFRQDPGKGLTLLFYVVSGTKKSGRLSSTTSLKDRHSSLYITASQAGDSATYFCAIPTSGGSYGKLVFGRGTILTIMPNIQNPQPALYQLRSPKSSNTSVCLLTDFGFYNGSIKNETVTGSEATVLEMMTMESKSYGAVTWGSKSNFTCTDAFRKDMFDFNQFSGSKCNSSHAEQGFETDRDLNLMNLSLIVLRIIFLKTVGFNLLMTLRLWSN